MPHGRLAVYGWLRCRRRTICSHTPSWKTLAIAVLQEGDDIRDVVTSSPGRPRAARWTKTLEEVPPVRRRLLAQQGLGNLLGVCVISRLLLLFPVPPVCPRSILNPVPRHSSEVKDVEII